MKFEIWMLSLMITFSWDFGLNYEELQKNFKFKDNILFSLEVK